MSGGLRAVDKIGIDVRVKFCDSRSKLSGAAHFVMDDYERQQSKVVAKGGKFRLIINKILGNIITFRLSCCRVQQFVSFSS